MNKEKLQKKVEDLSENGQWNCHYDFPHGIKTRSFHIDSPGYNLKKWPRLLTILNEFGLKGKTIIDIGCGDGYYAIQSSLNGASYSLGTDIDKLRIERALLAKEVLGVNNSDFKAIDLYKDKLGKFDILLGLGLLHRVPDLDGCMDIISKCCEIAVLEFKSLNKSEPIKEYMGGNSKSNKHNGLHYVPTQSYVINYMFNLGFTKHKIFNDTKSTLNYKRSIITFTKG